ncbi:hypothetical protein Ancab_006250 [Ancistrocladus abbreviatus]
MSLVDYAYSDEEDEIVAETHQEDRQETVLMPPPPPVVTAASVSQSQEQMPSLDQQDENATPLSASPIMKLPDASLLLNSPISSHLVSTTDHSSRVAAALAQNASRKREANGLASSTRGKVPRGSLPHSKNVPDTGGGQLVPPQLRGRSNVVTEDISKLFVGRKT